MRDYDAASVWDRVRWWWFAFICARRFRALYPDGRMSYPTTYDLANNLAGVFGGKVCLLDKEEKA